MLLSCFVQAKIRQENVFEKLKRKPKEISCGNRLTQSILFLKLLKSFGNFIICHNIKFDRVLERLKQNLDKHDWEADKILIYLILVPTTCIITNFLFRNSVIVIRTIFVNAFKKMSGKKTGRILRKRDKK